MSTETAAPANPPHSAPAAPAAPPIPPAQAASVPPPKAAPVSSRQPKDAPDAPPTIDADLKKLAADMLTPKPKVKAEAPPEKPAAEAPKTPDAKADKPATPAEKEPLDIPEPKGMTPENLANWKTWREQAKKEINEARNEKAALAAKLKTYETATPADNEKTARLEAKAKELEDKLAVFDLKSHPDFRKQYVEPKQNALKEAADIVAYNGKEGVDLNAILELPQKDFNAKVSELTKDMNGMDATTVQSALRQAHKLTGEEKGALSKAGELRQQLASKAAAEARRAFEETRSEFTTKVPEIAVPEGASPEKVAEIQAYNAARSEAMAEAERYSFNPMSERQVAQVAQQAAAMKVVAHHVIPALTRERDQAVALNRELAAELAAIKKSKAAPAFTGGKEAAKADDSNLSFQELADKMLTRKSG